MRVLFLALFVAGCSSEPANPPTPPVTPAAPAADPHAGHSAHMAEMAKQRTALRDAMGPAYDAPVPGLEGADLAKGEALYGAHCAGCHGGGGKGDGVAGAGLNPPPGDFTDAFHARYYSDAARVRIVRDGIPGTGMQGFSGVMSEGEVVEVYAYVRRFREGP